LLAKLGDATPNLLFVKDRASRMLYANNAAIRYVGKRWEDISGRSEAEWHDDPVEAANILGADERVMSSRPSDTFEEHFTGADGPVCLRVTKTPLIDQAGEVIGLAGISIDITREKEAERQAALLLRELNHRVKNTFAIVQAAARNAFSKLPGGREACEEFEGRLVVMAKAHELLSNADWTGADLKEVLQQTLAPHRDGGRRVHISGPAVELAAQTALALSMIVYELCTNATKYGALSNDAGRVTIEWSLNEKVVVLTWTERDGPRVRVPTHPGFGTSMIRRALSHDPRARVDVTYAPEGVICRIRCQTT
jgi:PAS domain S-box-containing protein